MITWLINENNVETCILLVRELVHDDETVSIKVDLDGIPLNQGTYAPEEKPTYGNIRKYVQDVHGLSVSSLYISQIKSKVGLEKRENYNVGTGEGRVPNCPSAKEAAIMDAFRHYGIIYNDMK